MSEPTVSPSNTSSSDYAEFLAQLGDTTFWEYAVAISTPTSQVLLPAPELLLCTSEENSYLLPLQHLREILSAPSEYTILPEHPIWMLGLMAWRSEIVPVLDLCAYLLQRPAHWRREDTLLITEYDQYCIAWLVPMVETIPISVLESDADIGLSSQEAWLSSLPSALIIQIYAGLPLLNLEKMILEVVQQIKVVAADE